MTTKGAPPSLARALFQIAARREDRDVMLGDLYEEFLVREANSPERARSWFWEQTIRSAPPLLAHRLLSGRARQWGIALAAIIGALAFTELWDMLLARKSAQVFVAMTEATSYGPARLVYFCVQGIGFGIAGAFIARVTFRRDLSYLQNASRRLVPAAVILLAPALTQIIFRRTDYSISALMMPLVISALAIAIGAAAAHLKR